MYKFSHTHSQSQANAPSLQREMSWLTPKRRRTTGNLRTVSNGRASSEAARPSVSVSSSGSPTIERPSSMSRTISQPVVGDADADGNLFYAYARKSNDLRARYLLTFASASVANEWWLLLQIHFPDTSRPSPQLFSFQTDDLLSKAWKHPSFVHLKSKWMYISFSDTSNDGLKGTEQAVIPVQDVQGHLIGGSGSIGGVRDFLPEVKQEMRAIQNGVKDGAGRLEETFAQMMEALERNTKQAAELAKRIQPPDRSREMNGTARDSEISEPSSRGGYFDMDAMSTHFSRLNDLLSKNSQHVETLTEKHYDNEQKLRETMDSLASRQNNGLDMQQLSTHLNRIQSMIEDSVKDRRDSARELSERPTQIDFSPLTQRLEKVQEAVEQNSALIKALLDEGTTSAETKEQPAALDLSPLNDHLERIHSALEQQSEHTKSLVGFASGESEVPDSGPAAQDRNLAPLGEHLEQIYTAIQEGNKHARETPQQSFDLAPLHRHLKSTQEHQNKIMESMQRIHDAIQGINERDREPRGGLDLSPLERHLENLSSHSEKNNEHMQQLLEAQNATREAVEANGGELDFTPLSEYLEAMRESAESNAEAMRHLIENRLQENSVGVDFSTNDHLESIRRATEENTDQLRNLIMSQQASASKSTASPANIDLSPLTDRLNSIHSSLEKQADFYETNQSTGDSKFLLNTLTSHFSKIQNLTEQNATQTKSLREKQTSSTAKMEKAIATTSSQLQSLIERNNENENRIEAQNSQLRELMSGQREMVEVMRQLARSVVAQNKGACDHVVVPPPRKMDRKVVGFVYDTKNGVP